jgi:hypothetical protein
MLSSRTIKFLTVSVLIAVAIFATLSMVSLSANESASNVSQDAGLAIEFDDQYDNPVRPPDSFDKPKQGGRGRR